MYIPKVLLNDFHPGPNVDINNNGLILKLIFYLLLCIVYLKCIPILCHPFLVAEVLGADGSEPYQAAHSQNFRRGGDPVRRDEKRHRMTVGICESFTPVLPDAPKRMFSGETSS